MCFQKEQRESSDSRKSERRQDVRCWEPAARPLLSRLLGFCQKAGEWRKHGGSQRMRSLDFSRLFWGNEEKQPKRHVVPLGTLITMQGRTFASSLVVSGYLRCERCTRIHATRVWLKDPSSGNATRPIIGYRFTLVGNGPPRPICVLRLHICMPERMLYTL